MESSDLAKKTDWGRTVGITIYVVGLTCLGVVLVVSMALFLKSSWELLF